MRWREGYVPGGDTRFWVRETGRGDDLAVLLHGFPHDGRSWGAVAELLAGTGWRVAAPDVRGVGRTVSDHVARDPRVLADEVSQLVRNLHGDRVVLVGHGWGGAMALATAFRHPGRVAGLVLVAAPYRRLDLRAAWPIALTHVPLLPSLAMRFAPGPVVGHAVRSHVAPGTTVDRAVVRDAAEAVSADPAGWLAYQRALTRRSLLEEAARRLRRRLPVPGPPAPPVLRVPAHVVWGEVDPLLPVALGEEVAEDLGATLDVLPGVGHHVPVEDPSGLAASVDRFAHRVQLAPQDAADAVGGAGGHPGP